MKSRVLSLAVMACASVISVVARADIRLPRVLSDHAVLQRQQPIHLWGWAAPSASVTVKFHHQNAHVVVDQVGKWSLYLQPEEAGGPFQLEVSGDGPILYVRDLLVGDVWIASGQSNMEMPLAGFKGQAVVKNADQEISSASNSKVRLLVLEHKSSNFPLDDITREWTECTPETAKVFSAVAYFFAREIAAREQVPVGVIDSTWGGTPADSWVSLDTLGSDPRLLPAFASRAEFANSLADVDATIAAEKREDEAAKQAARPLTKHSWHPYETSWLPSGLYNGMISPLTSLQVKGFIWYQGETNSSHDRAPHYHELFSALITDWREHFAQGNLPFLFVQISSFDSPGEDWGLVRDQQRQTLDVADTAMAVSLDVGLAGNVHPPDKQTVGARLALAARNKAYGEHVAFEGPAFRQAVLTEMPNAKEAVTVWFDHAEGLSTKGEVAGLFELAGADRQFRPAQFNVVGRTAVVSSEAVPKPKFVRFAWSSVVSGDLYNAEGFPASTFRSEVH